MKARIIPRQGQVDPRYYEDLLDCPTIRKTIEEKPLENKKNGTVIFISQQEESESRKSRTRRFKLLRKEDLKVLEEEYK